MNKEEAIALIRQKFNKPIVGIVFLDGRYYFGLLDDHELDYTMNTRFLDAETKKFDLFNAMDDIPLYEKLLKINYEEVDKASCIIP